MRGRRLSDLTGLTFGLLTAMESSFGQSGVQRVRLWTCRCTCGGVVIVRHCNLRNGHTTSCGCGKNVTHGNAFKGRRTPEYSAWDRMIQRCTNQRRDTYHHYGGRGIQVSERWRTFENFLADMGAKPSRRHTLERVDNGRGYEPGNVIWATMAVQMRNTRDNRLVTFDGVTLCVADWGLRQGLCPHVIAGRLNRGWSAERALRTPVTR